jgi:cytidylate kinase
MSNNIFLDIKSKIKIAVDGEAGTGKGSICKRIATNFNLHYCQSGTYYRRLAYIALMQNIKDVDKIIEIAKNPSQLEAVDDADICNDEVAEVTSEIAAIEQVREALLGVQKEVFVRFPRVIMEGRDIGTVIAPDAQIKLYFTADIDARAKRRAAQYRVSRIQAHEDEVKEKMIERDRRDKSRKDAPLVIAPDAIVLDNSEDGIEAFYQKVLEAIKNRAAQISQ